MVERRLPQKQVIYSQTSNDFYSKQDLQQNQNETDRSQYIDYNDTRNNYIDQNIKIKNSCMFGEKDYSPPRQVAQKAKSISDRLNFSVRLAEKTKRRASQGWKFNLQKDKRPVTELPSSDITARDQIIPIKSAKQMQTQADELRKYDDDF